MTYFASSHYRSPMEFSRYLLDEAVQQVERLKNLFRALDDYLAAPPAADAPSCANETEVIHAFAVRRQAFSEAMADDLNTGAALERGLRAGPRGERRPGRTPHRGRSRSHDPHHGMGRWCTSWGWMRRP